MVHMAAHVPAHAWRRLSHAARSSAKEISEDSKKLYPCRQNNKKYGRANSIRLAKHATGWKLIELQNFIKELDRYIADCDASAFGTENKKGEPLLKQWRILTDCGRLAKAFSEKRCRHEKGFRHGEIAGAASPKSASYPFAMCETIASA